MLYVDGMNGVMEHNETVQWLYALIASKFRLVVKTALKLLLVFIEYVETNCLLLIKAVHAVDTAHGKRHKFWSGMCGDTEYLFNATPYGSLLTKLFTVIHIEWTLHAPTFFRAISNVFVKKNIDKQALQYNITILSVLFPVSSVKIFWYVFIVKIIEP